MSKQTSSYLPETTCSKKCRLKEHGKRITSAITKTNISDYQIACFITSLCGNFSQVCDEEGRNALHVAASCGRRDLCYWLTKACKADLNFKDNESGYTALHRSLFYGHINNAVFLIEMGARMNLMDREDLLACDNAMKDRLIQEFSNHNPCQVYVWGSNNNYTLGTGNQQSRTNPDLVDFFRKNNISVKQVAMDKFHSVFVSSDGRAWACGHGQGGRLGLEAETTVLSPRLIKIGTELVACAAVGCNHTILLMESGTVWTCGLNEHHVLGHSPPPPSLLVPRPLHPRVLKDLEGGGGGVVGVAAARYTSVLWTQSSVLTWGLNAGQLGHPRTKERTIIVPKQVTGIKNKIVDVATSMGAVVVCVSKGQVVYHQRCQEACLIYLLNKYEIRRITARILDVVKVSVFGGELSPELDAKLNTRGGEDVRVAALNKAGELLLWQESCSQFIKCANPLRRSLTFNGIFLIPSSIFLMTNDGEAYIGHVKPKASKSLNVSVSKPENEGVSFNEYASKIDCYSMSLKRVPNVYRATNITADPKGLNFVVIQENPKVNLTDIPLLDESEFCQQMALLLNEVDEDDSLHDVLIEVDKGCVAAHHFVLANCSEEFATAPRSGPVLSYRLEGVDVYVVSQVLKFAYTNDCDILHLGPLHVLNNDLDVVKATFGVAKKLRIPKLIKCLQLLRYENGVVSVKDEESVALLRPSPACWARSTFPSLHDVTLTSADSRTFKAHKCVLAARLEYFNHMFCGGWIEASGTSSLTLPVPGTVLEEVLDFLYTDEAPSLMESQDVDYISSVLIVSDQLFIKRLKQVCEVALVGNLTLRNTAYLLQLSITYGADQLRSCCMQFICLNLAAVLDNRVLEILDNKTLEELSRYYRSMIPAMRKRRITPYSTSPSEGDIEEAASNFPVTWLDSEDLINEDESSKPKMNKSNVVTVASRKKARPRRTSESQRKRESISSNSDLDCSTDIDVAKVDFDDLKERNQKNEQKQEWITIDKNQKSVQSRLRAILMAPSIEPSPQEFTRLGLRTSTSPAAAPVPVPQHLLASSPPPPTIQDSIQFPELFTTPTRLSSSPKSSSLDEKKPKKSVVVKLSQKQRKKLLAEGGNWREESSPSPATVPVATPPPVRSPWAVISDNTECSLADIMRNTLSVGSSSSREKSEGLVKFADIVAEEIAQRDNWSKMKSKSLQLTQIEDKAMEDLLQFYNAANMFDERITVERVLSTNIAKPTWITSRNQ